MDERIRTLFVNQMRLILDQRNRVVAEAVNGVRAKATARGMLLSSMADRNVAKVYEDKYDELCKEAWSQLHRIAVTIGVEPNDSLIGKLREAFDEVMKPLADNYLGNIQRYNTMGRGITAESKDSFLRSRDIVGNEIELFSSNTAMAVSQSTGTTYIQNYTFSAPIAAFQQGEHATATVTRTSTRRGWRHSEVLSILYSRSLATMINWVRYWQSRR